LSDLLIVEVCEMQKPVSIFLTICPGESSRKSAVPPMILPEQLSGIDFQREA
jgi:hypothetical protein